MIRTLLARRGFAAFLAGAAALLAACSNSGNDSGGTAHWRMLNVNGELPAADVYTGNDLRFSNVTVDTVTNYQDIDANSYAVKITSAGNPTALLSATYSLSKDKHYTGVIWGRSGAVKFITLPEDEDTSQIASGNSRVRVYNATTDAGSLDVYLTAPGLDDLADATPTSSAVASASLGGFKDLTAGSYRLRVTTAGDSSDVRLDIPAVSFSSQQYSTLIITAGSGGVLVNSALLVQQGPLTEYKNTQARMRVVASADSRGSVSVQLDGATIAGSLRSPTVGPYLLVNAGNRLVDVLLNGTNVSSATRSLAAGGDYTLLAYGSNAAPGVTMIADDNRLAAAGRYRVRLINGIANSDPLTLSIDFAALVSDVPAGTGSSFVSAPINASAQVDVTSTSSVTPLFTATDVNLQTFGVYTMFMLGGNVDANGAQVPTGAPRKDR